MTSVSSAGLGEDPGTLVINSAMFHCEKQTQLSPSPSFAHTEFPASVSNLPCTLSLLFMNNLESERVLISYLFITWLNSGLTRHESCSTFISEMFWKLEVLTGLIYFSFSKDTCKSGPVTESPVPDQTSFNHGLSALSLSLPSSFKLQHRGSPTLAGEDSPASLLPLRDGLGRWSGLSASLAGHLRTFGRDLGHVASCTWRALVKRHRPQQSAVKRGWEREERSDWLRGFVVVVLSAHDHLTCAPTCGRGRRFLPLNLTKSDLEGHTHTHTHTHTL